MTNKEASKILENWFDLYSGDAQRIRYTPEKFKEAAKMAIEALKEKQESEIVPIGTKVRVIKNKHDHKFIIGEVVCIDDYDGSKIPYQCSNDSTYWFLSREEFEIVE